MGAQFNFEIMGKKEEKVKLIMDRFARMQKEDLYENGHSYSGGIGMCDGITNTRKKFEDEDEAEEWLEDNAQKWGPALLVSTEDDWIIGAWCSC